MLIGDEINIDNIPNGEMEDMFSKLMKKIIENADKPDKNRDNKKKIKVNIEVTPMLNGTVSAFSVNLSSEKEANKKEIYKEKKENIYNYDANSNELDYLNIFKIEQNNNEVKNNKIKNLFMAIPKLFYVIFLLTKDFISKKIDNFKYHRRTIKEQKKIKTMNNRRRKKVFMR
jgi:hypothetical protein